MVLQTLLMKHPSELGWVFEYEVKATNTVSILSDPSQQEQDHIMCTRFQSRSNNTLKRIQDQIHHLHTHGSHGLDLGYMIHVMSNKVVVP